MRPSPGKLRCAGPGQAAEHRSTGQSGAARVVEVEEVSDELTGRLKAWDWLPVHVNHVCRRIDAETAEGEGYAAGHHVGLERRLRNRVGPIRFRWFKVGGAPTVLDVGVERDLLAHRLVEVPYRLEKFGLVDTVEPVRELLQRVGSHRRH